MTTSVVLAACVWGVAGAASGQVAAPLSCRQPVLAMGQEAQIEPLFQGAVADPATGAALSGVEIDGGELTIRLQWTPPEPDMAAPRYLLRRLPAGAQLAHEPGPNLHLRRLAPCPRSAPHPAAACDEEVAKTRLARLGAALEEKVLTHGAQLLWRCPSSPEAPPGDGQSDGLRRVDEALARGDRQAASKALARVLARAPKDVATLTELAIAVRRVRGRLAAKPFFQAALRKASQRGPDDLPPMDPPTLVRLAGAHEAMGDHEAAMHLLVDCRAAPPAQRCRMGTLAQVLELSGNWKAASALLDEELGDWPKPPLDMYLERVAVAGRHDDGEAEVRVARAAVAAWPRQVAARQSLATALFRVAEHGEALAVLEGLYRLAPQTAGLLTLLDGVWSDMSRVATKEKGRQARQVLRANYEQRAAKDSNDLIAAFLQGIQDYHGGRFEAAIAAMRKVHRRWPDEGRPLVYQALAHHWLGQVEPATSLARQARRLAPDDPEVHYAHARVMRLRQPMIAIASIERYLALAGVPGRLQFSGKVAQAKLLLSQLRVGMLPPDSDQPGVMPAKATAKSLRDPFELPPPLLLFGALAAALLGLTVGWRWRAGR